MTREIILILLAAYCATGVVIAMRAVEINLQNGAFKSGVDGQWGHDALLVTLFVCATALVWPVFALRAWSKPR